MNYYKKLKLSIVKFILVTFYVTVKSNCARLKNDHKKTSHQISGTHDCEFIWKKGLLQV